MRAQQLFTRVTRQLPMTRYSGAVLNNVLVDNIIPLTSTTEVPTIRVVFFCPDAVNVSWTVHLSFLYGDVISSHSNALSVY